MAGDRKSVYIETSVVSYLTARPTSDLVAAAWQKITVDWWDTQRTRFDLYTSDVALRGGVFFDPCATEPYLFHLAVVTVEQYGAVSGGSEHATTAKLLESRLIGLRKSSDGTVAESPVERLLLRGAEDFAPSRVPLAGRASVLFPKSFNQ